MKADVVIRAELTGDDTCTALGITIKSPSPVLALCRKLVDAGYSPATELEAWRGDVLCLRTRFIGEAARLEVSSGGAGFVGRQERRRGAPIELDGEGAPG